MTLEEFLPRLSGVKKGSGNQYYAKCPAHKDEKASLSVSVGDDGRILLNCHVGCTAENIVQRLGLKTTDLFPDNKTTSVTKPKIVARYDYTDINGNLLNQKTRLSDKSFSWSHKEKGKWTRGHRGEPVLYNLPALKSNGDVFVVEGEKDVETMKRNGVIAVCGAHGAGPGKWLPQYTESLKGRNVIVIPDNDVQGKNFAVETCNALIGHAASVKMINLTDEWTNLQEKGDISDVFQMDKPEDVLVKLEALVTVTKELTSVDSEPETSGPKLDIISAQDLLKANLPPVKFIVNDMLPEGTGMISAPSKIGKSWLVLDMGLSVAAGTPFMGHQTNQCGVLYLALEDSLARLQNRMEKVLNGKPAPELFYFATKAPTLDNGLLDMLDDHVKQYPKTKFVIIDTLQKVRGQALPRESSYAQDYREMGIIKNFMDERGVSVFFVHHNRKMKDDDDPFNMISGTTAIMGAADTIMIMTKDKRSDGTATLHLTGRDISQSSTVVKFDTDTWKWCPIGEVSWVEDQRARQEYQGNPIVKTIKKLIEQMPGKRWDGTAKELLNAGKLIARTYIAPTATDLGHAIKKLDSPLFNYDGIIHTTSPNGNAGKIHHFYYSNVDNDEWEEVEPQEKIF